MRLNGSAGFTSLRFFAGRTVFKSPAAGLPAISSSSIASLNNGGAVFFIDNLDFFGSDERRTVIDLVREAGEIPGYAVVTTARRNFGVDEPSWLPIDVINRLGRADPIMIGELSEAEVDELRNGDPRLAPLLADTHPARDVSRNLFRLTRIANWSGDEPVPRTEIDMAGQWWKTADGPFDEEHRERARLLKYLAEQSISSNGPFDISRLPTKPVDA